jgi:hypothetical protein
MRRVLFVSAVAIAVVAGVASSAFAALPIHHETNHWYDATGVERAKVQELVFDEWNEATYGSGSGTDFLYLYVVENVGYNSTSGDLYEWEASFPFDTFLSDGSDSGWTKDTSGGTWNWSVDPGSGIGIAQTVNFWFVHVEKPFMMYPGKATGQVDSTTISTKDGELVSGPTPEPCTLALLGLGLSGAGMIRLLKRRRE